MTIDSNDPSVVVTWPANACEALCELAHREAAKGLTRQQFIRRLGFAGAGVRPGVLGLIDLARAGSNRLPGNGFLPEFDDGSGAQVRHFCGIAAACERFGPGLTWWLSVYVRDDPPDEPDGRLTDVAIEFVVLLQSGKLDVRDSARWIRLMLCAPLNENDSTRNDQPSAQAASRQRRQIRAEQSS